MNCESTDDETKTKILLSINILQIENDYETPIESKYYQINRKFNKKSDNTQNITDYAEQELKGSSSTINITKIQHVNYNHLKKKFRQFPLLLESPKSKHFQSPDLELDFLLDTRAELDIIVILT